MQSEVSQTVPPIPGDDVRLTKKSESEEEERRMRRYEVELIKWRENMRRYHTEMERLRENSRRYSTG